MTIQTQIACHHILSTHNETLFLEEFNWKTRNYKLTWSYYRPQRMFSQASMILFGGGEYSWQGGMHGRRVGVCMAGEGYAWQGVGVCMAGGHVWQGWHVCQGDMRNGGHTWQERRPLQRKVRILLECNLDQKKNNRKYLKLRERKQSHPAEVYFYNYLPLSGSCTMVRTFGRSITISCWSTCYNRQFKIKNSNNNFISTFQAQLFS